jgi:hypothetical protein
MIKQLILLIQVLGLFFYQLIFTGDIAVNQKVPKTLIQGQESTIEIIIKKAHAAGFAKIQQIIPEGFSVEPLETKGATFSFKDNKVKFIWMSLPAEAEFTISYQLKPNLTTIGDFSLGGKFSFIDQSERKNIEIPISSFSVVPEGLVKDEVALEITEEIAEAPNVDEIINKESTETAVIEEEVADVVDDSSSEEAIALTVICKRTIESIADKKFKVTIEIEKKGVEGFAKISEDIPKGFFASQLDSKGGIFSVKENKVKIIWMAIPNDDIYVVSFFIEATSSLSNGDYSIFGEYSYLDNDVSSKSDIDKVEFNYKGQEVIEEIVLAEAPSETNESLKNKPSDVESTNIEPDVVASIENVTSTPDSENGVTYKVQVGAGHKTVSSAYFKTKFNLKDEVSTINHEGWIKYLIGSFDEYKLARDKRNLSRKNVKTSFVTAYNSGTRITVQEALMISSQKWYK